MFLPVNQIKLNYGNQTDFTAAANNAKFMQQCRNKNFRYDIQ